MVAAAAARKAPSVFKTWFVVEATPIYAVVGGALLGASWYCTKLLRDPQVVYDRKGNPYPWLHVDQQTQLKLMTVKEGQGFTKSYSRAQL